MKSVFKLGLLVMALVIPLGAMAAGGGATFKEGVNYIAIKPALVVNYGGPGRVKYIKAEMSLRTEDAQSAAEVTHHMPLIRDTLIMLISSVTDEQMSSAEGKAKMRVEALAKINEALQKIADPDGADEAGEKGIKTKKGKDKTVKGEKKKGTDNKKKDAATEEDESEDGETEPKPKGPMVSDLLFDNLVVQK